MIKYEVLPQFKNIYADKQVKKYDDDAGFDLRFAKYIPNSVEIEQNRKTMWIYPDLIRIATGVNFEIPKGHVGLILDRSSVATKGLQVSGGVIDSGYYNEENGIVVVFHNIHNNEYYNLGDRIAQLIIVPVLNQFIEGTVEKGERGSNGFGSTGVK